MKIWLEENGTDEPHAFVSQPYPGCSVVELEGAEGKVLVDRETLRAVLAPNRRVPCLWPACLFGTRIAPAPAGQTVDGYVYENRHSGTCPLREEA